MTRANFANLCYALRAMKETKLKQEPLTHTLPATRVTKQVYQFLMKRMATEQRRRISEVIRLTLEDAAAKR